MAKDTSSENPNARYEAMIRQLTEYARREPGRYRARVALLAALGYAYIVLVLAVLLALLAGIAAALITGHVNAVTVKLGFFLAVLVWIILRSLWVTIPPPQGIPLSREGVPALFGMLDRATGALKAPRFHHVLLTDDFNAAVQQVPRLGVFGWQVNYLVLGLPLMAALSPRQFEAVVAHEIGHLSGNHSRFAAWVYRVRKTWVQLLDNLSGSRHKGKAVFEPFFRWYAPFFSAYSFVLARGDEYAADRCAADVAGREAAAEALVSVQVQGQFLEENFWPGLLEQARERADPPPAPLAEMFQALRGPSLADAAPQWLGRALGEKTNDFDTHPALADRLLALGYRPAPAVGGGGTVTDPPLPPPGRAPGETAAQSLLGGRLEGLTAQLEAAWRQAVAPQWRRQHTRAQEVRQKLWELNVRAAGGVALTAEERWNRAQWTADLNGGDAAMPLFREILAAEPDHAPARYALGALLLKADDSGGLAEMDRAMALDEDAVLPACEAAYAYLKRAGRPDEAQRYYDRGLARYQLQAAAEQERGSVLPGDAVLPPELPPKVLDSLRRQLAAEEGVRAAYIVRKDVRHLPERPLYIVGVVPRVRPLTLRSENASRDLVRALAKRIDLPVPFYVVPLDNAFKKMGKTMRQTPGALVAQR